VALFSRYENPAADVNGRRPVPEDARRSTVQAVERAADLLAQLAGRPAPVSALELARATGLDRTVVHRLLRTLVGRRLVHEQGGRYALGPATAQLGYAYVDGLGFRRPALMYGTDLAQQIVDRPWMVSIGAPIDDEVVLIDRIWGPRTPLNTILDIGTRLAFDGSALGRTMLAYLAADEVTRLVGEKRARAVARRLADIRRWDGVDVATDEVQPGVVGVAAVVRDPGGRPVGSMAIAGPSDDARLRDRDAVLLVRRAAHNVERTLPGFGRGRASS
jgi:IclR family acetate operon transcriptional repressor